MPQRGRPRGFDRNAALHKAMLVFWRRGFEGATLAELTEQMGIRPPSLYAAFGDKGALFTEAVELYMEGDGRGPLRALAEHDLVGDAMEAMLRVAADIYTDPAHPYGCLVTLGAVNCAPDNGAHEVELRAGRAYMSAAIRDRLARAADAGQVDLDDVGPLAEYFSSVLFGLALRARDGATRGDLRHVAETAVRVLR